MAFVGKPKNLKTARSPLWTVDTLKEELSRGVSTLTSICKRYSESPDKWRALYSDVNRWRKDFPELEELISENTRKTDPKKRDKISGGRPKNDEGNHDWMLKYCQELLKTKSRNRSASVTPYSPDQIYQMLNEKYSSYDREFSELVHQTEMRLVAWAEELMWKSLDDSTNPKDTAWIAKEILKVRDRQRWGDKLDISVQASHVHRHELDRGKMLLSLESDRREFFIQSTQKQLEPQIIDAEVVK